jgi:hypothetical protein
MKMQAPRPVPSSAALDEVARVEPARGEHAMLVVFPKDACSGSTPTIFTDPAGRFLGAVAPGDAAFLAVPDTLAQLLAFSAVDVSAPEGVWYHVDEVTRPSSVDLTAGLLLRSAWNPVGRGECGGGSYAVVRIATRTELDRALVEQPARWLSVDADEGQAWLDQHKPRVDELLGRTRRPEPRVVTRTSVP